MNNMDCFFVYDGIIAAQTKDINELFTETFLSSFDVIIEIGANRGGLTKYIADTLAGYPTLIYSYEIDPTVLMIPADYIPPHRGNIFLHTWKGHVEQLIRKLRANTRVLLLCDGGNKEEEFNELAPLLTYGDVIMLHDYTNGSNLAEFKRNGWYSMPEALYSNIERTVKSCILYEDPTTHKFLWGKFVKAHIEDMDNISGGS